MTRFAANNAAENSANPWEFDGSSSVTLSAESPTLPSNAASPLADVLRLHRRVYVLRACGEMVEAARLERTELAEARNAHRISGDPTSLEPLLAAEEARVAEAVLLADVLAPLLAARLAAQAPALASQTRSQPKSGRSELPTAIVPATDSAPTVADFIEGMLAQDRAVARAK